jgi:hypothetical protein
MPMGSQPSRVFRTNAASRLDDLELVAALFERDVSKGRAVCTERGVRVPPMRRRKRLLSHRARLPTAKVAALGRGVAIGTKHVAQHPRLFAAVDATAGFIIDLAIVLSTGVAATAILVAAYVIAAPPV